MSLKFQGQAIEVVSWTVAGVVVKDKYFGKAVIPTDCFKGEEKAALEKARAAAGVAPSL